jgi:hypothetical protein
MKSVADGKPMVWTEEELQALPDEGFTFDNRRRREDSGRGGKRRRGKADTV